MNKPAFQVTIPEPCHENWNEMTPREQGRFCSVCTKTVVDFSAMTDTELFDMLKGGSGNMCGHFHKDQLDRTITAPKKPKWILQPFWKYFLGVAMFFKPAASKAQGKPVCTPVIPEPHRTVGIIAVAPQPKVEKEITGKVVNENNEPIGGAIVNIKGTTKFAPADTKGNFKIKAHVGDILEVTDLQYDANTYRIGAENNLTITLTKAVLTHHLAGEIAVIPVPKPVEIVIDVLDMETGLPVKNAVITWNETDDIVHPRTEKTGNKGTVKTKILLTQQEINFSVQAQGYAVRSQSFSISELRGKKAITLYIEEYALRGKVSVQPEPIPQDVTLKNKIEADKKLQINQALQGHLGGITLQHINIEPAEPADKAIAYMEKQLIFYPNPVKKNGQVTLDFYHDKHETCMIQFTDVQGKIIMNHRFNSIKGNNTITISLGKNIVPGVLMANLMNSKGQWVASERVVVD